MPHPLTAAVLVLCCCAPGLARAVDTEQCRSGSFPAQEGVFGLAKATGAPRVFLRSDTPPCPDDSVACRAHGYIVPGDTVLTGMASGS